MYKKNNNNNLVKITIPSSTNQTVDIITMAKGLIFWAQSDKFKIWHLMEQKEDESPDAASSELVLQHILCTFSQGINQNEQENFRIESRTVGSAAASWRCSFWMIIIFTIHVHTSVATGWLRIGPNSVHCLGDICLEQAESQRKKLRFENVCMKNSLTVAQGSRILFPQEAFSKQA